MAMSESILLPRGLNMSCLLVLCSCRIVVLFHVVCILWCVLLVLYLVVCSVNFYMYVLIFLQSINTFCFEICLLKFILFNLYNIVEIYGLD